MPKFLHTDKINMILSAIAVCIAAISITAQFTQRKPEITCEILSSEQLAPLNTAEHLEAKYWFMGDPVSHLWKIRVQLKNTGKKTIIGEGQGSMLLHNNLTFDMPSGLSLIRVIEEQLDFPIVSSNVGNAVELSFAQWKEGESAFLSLYLSSTNTCSHEVLPASTKRELIDGEILVHIQKQSEAKQALSAFIPQSVSRIAYWVSIVLLGIFSLLFFWLPVNGMRELRRYIRWYTENEASLIYFIENKSELNREKVKYLKKPWKIPEIQKKEFGKPIPSVPQFESKLEAFVGICVFLFLGLSLVLYIIQTAVSG